MVLFHIVVIVVGILSIWFLTTTKNSIETFENSDDLLIQSYPFKPCYEKRVVLIIESFNNIQDVLTLIRNILKQEMKVHSIILTTSENESLKEDPLILKTCIFNKIGGLSYMFKESSVDTILIYLFSEGFVRFSDPYFLRKFLNTDVKVDGILKSKTDDVKVSIDQVYN